MVLKQDLQRNNENLKLYRESFFHYCFAQWKFRGWTIIEPSAFFITNHHEYLMVVRAWKKKKKKWNQMAFFLFLCIGEKKFIMGRYFLGVNGQTWFRAFICRRVHLGRLHEQTGIRVTFRLSYGSLRHRSVDGYMSTQVSHSPINHRIRHQTALNEMLSTLDQHRICT